MSCQPTIDASRSFEGPMSDVSMSVSTPTVMAAMTMRPMTMAPWMVSVMNETLNPPRAVRKDGVSPLVGCGRCPRHRTHRYRWS